MSKNIRVVRSDGTVEHDWQIAADLGGRILIKKWSNEDGAWLTKCPPFALYDHWQAGGVARNTKELNEA